MKPILWGILVAVAVPSSAAGPADRAAELAAQLSGATLPAPEAPAVPAATPIKEFQADAANPGTVSGYIRMSGGGGIICPMGGGQRSGWINLNADVRVTTADGASGLVALTGSAFVTGFCQGGGGFVSGNAQVDGTAPLMKDGRKTGRVRLHGTAVINQYGSSSYVWVDQDVYVSGTVDPVP